MTISIKEIKTGYAISFPFQLKDNFRDTFKSAKWNYEQRQWEVRTSSKTKLYQWAEAVSELADEIIKADEQEMTQREIVKLKSEIEKIRLEIRLNRQEKKLAEDSKSLLMSAKNELLEVKQSLNDERLALAKERGECKVILNDRCDLTSILFSQRIMVKLFNQVGRDARIKYYKAQDTIIREQERLLSINIRSEGIDKLASMNFNRPDRDNPLSVEMKDILSISKTDF